MSHNPKTAAGPLKHYERAEMSLRRCSSRPQHGFFYALSYPRADYIQIGIGTSSNYDLNRQHQLLENVHYHDVTHVAHQIAMGDYVMTDGPLTQRFFGDESDYRQRAHLMGGPTELKSSKITLPNGAALAHTMVKMHREVFGDPLKGADVIALGEGWPVELVVRYDAFLKRVVIGLTPARGPNEAATEPHLHYGPNWEFAESLRLTQTRAYHAATRWLQAGGVYLPPPAINVSPNAPDLQLGGETLQKLCCAVVRQADRAWGAPGK